MGEFNPLVNELFNFRVFLMAANIIFIDDCLLLNLTFDNEKGRLCYTINNLISPIQIANHVKRFPHILFC